MLVLSKMVKTKKQINKELVRSAIRDYWNNWISKAWDIEDVKEGDEKALKRLKENPVKTFEEYAIGMPYEEGRVQKTTVFPEPFIWKINKLVRIYNHLITQQKLDINKLERTVNLARRVVYAERYTK